MDLQTQITLTSEMTAMKKKHELRNIGNHCRLCSKSNFKGLNLLKYIMDFLVLEYILLTYKLHYSSEKSVKEMNKKVISKVKKNYVYKKVISKVKKIK